MTFNSSQQERLLTALERIADALEAQAKPPRFVHYGGKTFDRVREDPMPFLPTEPYTVIRVAWRSDSARPALGDLGIRTLFPDGTWTGWAAENLLERITGFEVLAEPRAVTAKAVLDRIASEPWTREVDLTKWRHEFGVPA